MRGRVNAAVHENLERVFAHERRRAAVRMAWARLIFTVLVSLVVWTVELGDERLDATRWGSLAFVVIAALVLGVTLKIRALGKWATLSVAVVDVPLLGAIQIVQQPTLPVMWHGIPTSVAFMSLLIVLSTLSLSRVVVGLTTVAGVLNVLIILRRADFPWPPTVLSLMGPAGIGAIGALLVGRVKALVHEARQRDLLGKYVLGDRVGAGGMAEVFLATYSPEGGFERKVAVKRILPSYADNPESIVLFRREAQLGALLAHPNIVQVLDFGADGQTWFLAMEFVDGVSLGKVLAHCRRTGELLPLPVVGWIASELATAVDYIHTRTAPTGEPLALVHRDLNPPNVLLSRIGEVKLSDFGIARASTQETVTAEGILRGKVGYSSPEQLTGQPYDGRADLYALGVTLYEVITSRRLFTGDSDLNLYRACLEMPIRPTAEGRPDVPPGLDQVVLGLLERDPSARTPSAHAVVQALQALEPELGDFTQGRKQVAEVVARVLAIPRGQGEPPPTPEQAATVPAVPAPAKP